MYLYQASNKGEIYKISRSGAHPIASGGVRSELGVRTQIHTIYYEESVESI